MSVSTKRSSSKASKFVVSFPNSSDKYEDFWNPQIQKPFMKYVQQQLTIKSNSFNKIKHGDVIYWKEYYETGEKYNGLFFYDEKSNKIVPPNTGNGDHDVIPWKFTCFVDFNINYWDTIDGLYGLCTYPCNLSKFFDQMKSTKVILDEKEGELVCKFDWNNETYVFFTNKKNLSKIKLKKVYLQRGEEAISGNYTDYENYDVYLGSKRTRSTRMKNVLVYL